MSFRDPLPAIAQAQPSWRAGAETSIMDALAAAGLELAGVISECHRRTWSVVLQVPTSGGLCYFKAPAQSLTHKCRQLQILSRIAPLMTARVIAIDASAVVLVPR
jgi:hypothetical protein